MTTENGKPQSLGPFSSGRLIDKWSSYGFLLGECQSAGSVGHTWNLGLVKEHFELCSTRRYYTEYKCITCNTVITR